METDQSASHIRIHYHASKAVAQSAAAELYIIICPNGGQDEMILHDHKHDEIVPVDGGLVLHPQRFCSNIMYSSPTACSVLRHTCTRYRNRYAATIRCWSRCTGKALSCASPSIAYSNHTTDKRGLYRANLSPQHLLSLRLQKHGVACGHDLACDIHECSRGCCLNNT